MLESWLLELLKGIVKLFLHPVLYFSIFFAVFAGYMRVKRERSDFNARVHPGSHELKNIFPTGIIAGLILSLIFIILGIAVPMVILTTIAIFTIVLALIGHARFLSSAITIGLSLIFTYMMSASGIEIPYYETAFQSINLNFITSGLIMIGFLTIAEGYLMLKNGLKDISPKLRKSKRGLTVGALQTKRFWLLPIFLFLPTGQLTAPFSWWPVIEWGTQNYSLILIPFLLGYQQQIQTALPDIVINRLGRQVMLLGSIILALSIAGLYYPTYIPIATVIFAIIGRLWIAYRHRVRENSTNYFFTPRNSGIMILDVLPESPADKMGLKTGEIIQTCNQIPVKNKQDLYEALLKNRAYCKLEVLDRNDEIRLLQRALYENDHHELGIIFIEKRENRGKSEAV